MITIDFLLFFLGGDQFDIEGQEVGELAQLSLDEPELERMTFQDAEEGEGTGIGTGTEGEPEEDEF